jgi:hypothetical protein
MERITLGQTRDQIAGLATTSRPTLLNDVTVLDVQRPPPRDCGGAGPLFADPINVGYGN